MEATSKQIAYALRCISVDARNKLPCIGEKCPYRLVDVLDEDFFRLTGQKELKSCDFDQIGLDSAELIEKELCCK